MRVLAIGDIHGCSLAPDALLGSLAPTSDDLIITLGDYVDYGPNSSGVLERLVKLSSALRLVPLRGNHEEMMLRARTDPNERELWLKLGGTATERSYGRAGISQAHFDFIEHQCVDSFETASHFFAHGGVNPSLPLAQQSVADLRWRTFHNPRPHCLGKILVCGHTTQKSGWPRDVGHSMCIDTGACCGGWLTCLDPQTRAFWQSNQQGELRRGHLDERRGAVLDQ